MATVLKVKNNDFVGAYQEYYINSMITKQKWKNTFSEKWLAAGGSTLNFNTRTYFGGRVYISDVATSSDILDACGFDEAGRLELTNTIANSAVSGVYLNFSPTQVYALNGLDFYFKNDLYVLLYKFRGFSLALTHTSVEYIDQLPTPLTPYSFKASPTDTARTSTVFDSIISVSTGNAQSDVAIETIYRLTSWFEELLSVNLSVVENQITTTTTAGDVITYKYVTTATITLGDISYFSDSVKIQELYNIIYLGSFDNSYYTLVDSASTVNYAGSLWSIEYKNSSSSDVWRGFDFSDGGADFFIKNGGTYWIDTLKWKAASPNFCLLSLEQLLNVQIDQKSTYIFGGWLGSFVTAVLRLIDTVVNILGTVAYLATAYTLVEFAKIAGLLSNEDAYMLKSVYIKVVGTIALILITYGVDSLVSAPSTVATTTASATTATVSTTTTVLNTIGLIGDGLSIVGSGMNEYSKVKSEESFNIAEEEVVQEDLADTMGVVYESTNSDDVDIADMFYENIYNFMDSVTES